MTERGAVLATSGSLGPSTTTVLIKVPLAAVFVSVWDKRGGVGVSLARCF
jgi:hypothetical protein